MKLISKEDQMSVLSLFSFLLTQHTRILANTWHLLSSLDDNGSFINGQGLRVRVLIPLETFAMSKTNRLSIPAVRQILARLAKGEKEEDELVEKLEDSCLRYDHDKKGVMGPVLQCLNIYCDF